MKGKRVRIWLAVLLVLAGSLLAGCTERVRPLEKYDAQYFDYFDTVTTFTVYAESEEQFEACEETFRTELERYHKLFDIYNTYEGINNIKTINDNAGVVPVKVDQEIIDLLKFAEEQYEVTGGKMNVAMGSVLSIWHDYREYAGETPGKAQIPDMAELEKAAEHMDASKLVIDETAMTVYLEDMSMRLDVGAVAKGYATWRISETLREQGTKSALLSVGGNVQCIGTKGDGSSWRVGIQNPDTSSQQSYLHVVNLQDMALVTSGTYQRYYEVDGVRYHHIINPDTLMPWREYDSVTILCKNGGMADALSTAVFNMTAEEGMELIESLEETEALWIYPDGREEMSSGFGQYMD